MFSLFRMIILIFAAAFIFTAPSLSVAASADDYVRPTQDEIQQEVLDINAAIQAKGAKWVAGETSMTRLSPAERRMRLGAFMPPPGGQTAPATISGAGSTAEAGKLLPATVSAPTGVLDWRSYTGGSFNITPGSYVTPIRDQGDCGGCWAFGSVAGLESKTLITMNTPITAAYTDLELSEEVVLTCDSADGSGCNGGVPVTDFFVNTGVPIESCYPYSYDTYYYGTTGNCSDACTSYSEGIGNYKISGSPAYTWIANFWGPDGFNLPETAPTVNGLRNALYNYGPVVVSMEVFSDFYSYTSGIYERTPGSTDQGGHVVLLVGYDDTGNASTGGGYFIVKNSWSTSWGENGFFNIAYNQVGGAVPTWDKSAQSWVFTDTFLGGYALAYSTAVPPVLYTNINYPANGSDLNWNVNGASCTITGTAAADSPNTLTQVEVSTDGATWHAATDTAGNGTWTTWSYNWALPTDGSYTIMAKAVDNVGNIKTSATASVTVDSALPKVSIASPANNAVLKGATATISGEASDAGGPGVASVKVGITPSDGTTTWYTAAGTTSWSYKWTLPVNGSYAVNAMITDKAGNTATSAVTNISVDNTLTVAITAPAKGALIGANYVIRGTASDTGSGVALVQVGVTPTGG
ncbi:MAG: C1 family peptidase, partial [Nitrospirota bacterium]